MTNDPITDPPAIVRDVHDVIAQDRIRALMDEAISLGRRTFEQAAECGRKLIEVQEECLRQTDGKPGLFLKTLADFKVSRATAYRLMRKARNFRNLNLRLPLEAVYDDGQPTPDESDKLVCRDCRIRGKKYSRDCRACRALNRPTPRPKVLTPIVDGDGTPVPERLQPVWLDALTIRQWGKQLADFGTALEGMRERPGCSAIRVEELRKRLKAVLNQAWAYRPGYVCAECQGEGCGPCEDRGWMPWCVVQDQRAAEKAREWKAKKADQPPVPGVNHDPGRTVLGSRGH